MMFKKALLVTAITCGLFNIEAQARSWVDKSENRIVTNVVMEDTIVMRSDTVFREVARTHECYAL